MARSQTNRRDLLKGLAAAPAATLAACARSSVAPRAAFTHGVASGDPTPTSVILWTRAVPTGGGSGGAVALRWQVARDAAFDDIVAAGETRAAPERDFTTKADAGGLEPGARYHYRFLAGDAVSPIGRTKTLPAGRVDKAALAVVSCSNFSWGYFNVYGALAARDDLDAVLHLGDYVYEYPVGVYPARELIVADRRVVPEGEALTLADYRQRYALYRSDPDLAALHAAHPMIAVWDDHEFANDAWKDGAENHNEGEGEWTARRAAALRAWREWMPVRETQDVRAGRIYRAFDLGGLARLIMLDARLAGRAAQVSYARDLKLDPKAHREDQIAAVALFRRDFLERADRSLLGADQEAWLAAQLAGSKAAGQSWQVLGQQVLLGKLMIPREAPALIDAEKTHESIREQVMQLAGLGAFGLPVSLDGWSGYPAARRRLLGDILENANNAVALAGDSHNAWVSELGEGGTRAAAEFAASSVSSPGFESILPTDPRRLTDAFIETNDELKWANLAERGYVLLTLRAEEARAEYWFADTVKAPSTDMRRGATFAIAATREAGVAAIRKI